MQRCRGAEAARLLPHRRQLGTLPPQRLPQRDAESARCRRRLVLARAPLSLIRRLGRLRGSGLGSGSGSG